jgi:hypothetical protein
MLPRTHTIAALVIAALTHFSGLCTPASAQPSPTTSTPAAAEPALPERLQALHDLLDVREGLRTQIDPLRSQLKNTSTDDAKTPLKNQLDTLEKSRLDNETRFAQTASGLTDADFYNAPSGEFNLVRELNEVVRPTVEALKDFTERPRQLEALRTQKTEVIRRLTLSQEALTRLDDLLTQVPKNERYTRLRRELTTQQTQWKNRLAEATNEQQLLSLRQQDLESKTESLWQILSGTGRRFLLTRGVNFLLSLIAAALAFFGLRWLHTLIIRLSPWHRQRPRASFASRLFDVIWHALTGLGAILAGLAVLYISGDWLLMGLAFIILIALALAAKHGLPRFYRQARLLLNLGEVREGERLVINHVPYLVKKINFYSHLENPAIRGPGLRLPLDALLTQISRPHESHEPWFPCAEGDWVQLLDHTYGRVTHITPEFVQLVLLGGSRKTYATPAFLAQTPHNFSHGFRLTAVVGLDYRHQTEALTRIPELLHHHIFEGLISHCGRDAVKRLRVDFQKMNASSLDYEIIADFDGSIAEKQTYLYRTLQNLALDCFTQNHLHPAFPQLVMRQPTS